MRKRIADTIIMLILLLGPALLLSWCKAEEISDRPTAPAKQTQPAADRPLATDDVYQLSH